MTTRRRRKSQPADGTTVVVFPFDLFGNAGTGAGAQLLGDALREAIDDTAAEPTPTRPHAFADRLDVREFGFDTLAEVADWRAVGRDAARDALAAGFTVWLAGNHLGVLPVYEALGRGDLVVQFDAHLDCYALHDSTPDLSHGNWLRHAKSHHSRPNSRQAGEFGLGAAVVNVGHRDIFQRPADLTPYFAATHPAEAIAADLPGVLADLRGRCDAADRVWLDVDADVFDPAFAPGVHQPTPFGLTPPQFLAVLRAVWSPKVVGFSVSEFDPGRDVRDATANLLGWLTERVLLLRYEV